MRATRGALATLLAVGAAGFAAPGGDPPAVAPASPGAPMTPPAPFTERVKGSAVSYEMLPVPAPAGGKAFWIGKTEIPWELLDIWVYNLDESDHSAASDAVTRPTKPYISMDRGFGHQGFPAISVSFKGASTFCEWLSAKTGRTYRLPTLAEWQHACRLGGVSTVDEGACKEYAWFGANGESRTHAIGSRKADRLGLQDMLGNAAEWVVMPDGTHAIVGGCFRDPISKIGANAVVPESKAWNDSDPQIPKSLWWLADGGFIGLRVVCDDPTVKPPQPDAKPGTSKP